MTERTMTNKGVNYAVKALMTQLGYGHLSVHTRSALMGRKFVTSVIVGKDRHLRRNLAQAMRSRWGYTVTENEDGSVTMVSPTTWHGGADV